MGQRLLEKVKSGLVALINQHDYIEGFAIDGRTAAGYKPGEYVNVDLILASYRVLPKDIMLVRKDLNRKFQLLSGGLELHIRLPIAKDRFGSTLKRAFDPETIYVFRLRETMAKWGPDPSAEIYFADSR